MDKEDLLADFRKEGEDPFAEQEETPAESPPEKEEEEPSQEGEAERAEEESSAGSNTPAEDNVPFHKHPRWKELVQERNDLRERVEQISQQQEDMSSRLSESGKEKPIPKWFAESFGENETAWQDFQQYDKQLRQDIKDEIYQEQQLFAEQQQKESQKWDNWVAEQITGLQDEGMKFDRNELTKVMLDYKPTDDQGNLDFRKGHDILTKLKAAEQVEKSKKTEEKKKVASQTMEGTGEPKKKDFLTSEDLKYRDFRDLAT